MTKLLEQAFEVAAKLPEAEQDLWAKTWLLELEDERRWDEQFAGSLDALDGLAKEARTELRAGTTQPLEDILEIADDK